MLLNSENSGLSESDRKLKFKRFLTTSLKILPVLFLMAALISSVYTLRSRRSYRSEAGNTSQIVNKQDRIKAINGSIIDNARMIGGQAVSQQTATNLRPLLAERKTIMLSFLPNEPDKFLENVLSENIVKNLPAEFLSEKLIETKKEVKGKLKVSVLEDFNNKKASYRFTLDDKNLYIPSKSEPLRGSGETIVLAYSMENNLVVENPATDIQYSSLIPPIFGPQKTLMVIVNADYDPADLDPQIVRDGIFGVTDSVASYYSETSRNKMSIVGEVAPVVTISNVVNKCDPYYIISPAVSELIKLGYVINEYRLIQFYIPRAVGCNWWYSGMADIGDPQSIVVGNDIYYKSISEHEMGHNFALGWIDENEYLFLKNDQQVEIYAHELTDPGLKIVRIWRNEDKQYLYLSFRLSVGLDSVLPSTITRGINVHLTKSDQDTTKTYFLDMTPSGSGAADDWLDAAMFDGQTFTDEAANIVISQISHAENRAVVQINIPENYPPRLQTAWVLGLYRLPDGRWVADPNVSVMSHIIGYDFSDAISIKRIVNYPDGTVDNLEMSISERNDPGCQEIKCYSGQDADFVTNQIGSYKLTFVAQDSQGVMSNMINYDFFVTDGPIEITPSPTKVPPTPTPSYTPSPTPGKATIIPKPSNSPTPSSALTPSPTPTPSFISLEPIADSYVNSSYPNNNSGTENTLRVKTTPTKITYLKFDLTSFLGKTVNSVKLKIWIADSSNGSMELKQVADNSWTEKGITYNNRPAPGKTLNTFTPVKSGVYQEIDISAYVKGNLGKIISLAIQTSSTNELELRSRNVSDQSKRPVLVIQ